MKKSNVIKGIYEIIGLLNDVKYSRINLFVIVILQLLTTIMEGIGVTALIPVLELLFSTGDAGSVANQSIVLKALSQFYIWLGIPVTLTSVVSLLVISVIFRQILKTATMLANMIALARLIKSIREIGVNRILKSKLEYFENESAGNITNNLVTEVEQSARSVFAAVSAVGTIILLIVYAILLFFISKIAIVSLVILTVAVGLILKGILKKSYQYGKDLTASNGALSAYLVERIRSIRLVKLAGTETREKHEFHSINSTLTQSLISLTKLRSMVPLLIEPIGFFTVMGYMILSTKYTNLSFEASIVVIGMMGRLLPVIQELAMFSQKLVGAAASMQAVRWRLRDLQASKEDDGGEIEHKELVSSINVDNVSYSYASSSEKATLHQVGFVINRGEFVAVVGPSGGGKSTLIELLSGLRKPSHGTISIDGCDINSFTRESLRDAFAFVPQSPHVLDRTIGDHIRYGNREATKEDVIRSAKLAGALSFIQQLPNGFETHLGEGGAGLSGGQRQRIDIARAILQASPILILDEPTAGLDVDSVYEVQQALHRICKDLGTTIILISHNLATASSADKIVVLQNGSCEGVGTHTFLMGQAGWYAQAHKKQIMSSTKQLDVAHESK